MSIQRPSPPRPRIPAYAWWQNAASTFDTVKEFLKRAKKADLSENGHECGHQFEVTFRSCGHTGIVDQGPESHTDDNWWSEPAGIVVRANNLRDALLLAAAEPLTVWFPGFVADVQATMPEPHPGADA